jgi:dolichol-phosphate mannosyltransferase
MSRLLNRAYAVVLGIHARDLSTNYKLYRASVLTDIKLSCQNFDIVEEILAKARQADPGIVVKEIPDYFHQRRYGESKRRLGPFVASYLVTLARLRWETRSRQ